MDKLKPCPWCGETPDEAFENLKDNAFDEPEQCFTILHACPVLKENIWASGTLKEDAHNVWNTRPGVEQAVGDGNA